jgi:hypothetical protein
MAYSATTQTIFDGGRKLVYAYHTSSDGTNGGTTTIDASSFNANVNGDACTYLDINKIWFNASFTAPADSVEINFDATSDDIATYLSTGQTDFDYSSFGGIKNPRSSGVTGDINIVFPVATAGDKVSIIFEFLKRYETL